ncbi:MAG: segregation and condensation protein A [Phaeodactylibacter xiamenensis]|uniref:Segregation and condensation protein A n=1 Tax=Phaeodactylibacter xiamenensis TaxID=1524460 RepID=A0A098SBJ6_9BACT|nr:segregation/condensation protein A [Phaeodactylibacter xiamenensis]KGE89525.1 chromosome segregation protein ScpA [Phaeodactylibacter xiamenensis]MCR9054058.1 segregation/condensation protein A [bacterium]
MSDTSYTIKLPQFEGPFDLLLFFIERDELDINDIPIAKITDDFLAYIRQMEEMNIDLASEFILVAATLCRIKAKMLIPRKPVDEEGNEIDPREELVQRLIEYKRVKSVLEEMRQMEARRAKQSYRGNVTKELHSIATKALVDAELESVTLFKLLRAFERIVERFEYANPKTIHQIVQFSYTIEGQQEHIFSRIQGGRRATFTEVFSACRNRIHAIVTFLALLELLNLQEIRITVGLGYNNFWVEEYRASEEEE